MRGEGCAGRTAGVSETSLGITALLPNFSATFICGANRGPPVHAGGFFCNSRRMPERAGDEFKLLLARAFDRAWNRYYRPSRIGAISASAARPALAKHLIASAKEGAVSVDALAQGGLLHLISLTPEAQHWGHLRIEGAGARFQQEWRVRFTLKASKPV